MNPAAQVEEHQKIDGNGEAIIAEAVCDRSKVCLEVCCWYYILASVTCLICLPCALVLGLVFSRKAAAEWRLYLTSTGLHHIKVGVLGQRQVVFIPLSDIEDVIVRETILIHNGVGSSQGHTLKVRINSDKTAEYIPWCQRTLCLLDNLDFGFIENAQDFGAAIKRQKIGATIQLIR